MDSESELASVVYQMIMLHRHEEFNPAEPKFISLAIQTMSLLSSMDLDSQPQSRLISYLKRLIAASRSVREWEQGWTLISHVTEMSSFSSSMDTKQQRERDLVPFITGTVYWFNQLSEHPIARRSNLYLILHGFIRHVTFLGKTAEWESELELPIPPVMNLQLVPGSKLKPNIIQFGLTQLHVARSSSAVVDSYEALETEELLSLLLQMWIFIQSKHYKVTKELTPEFILLAIQTMSLVSSVDLDSRPQSKFIVSLKKLITVSRSISETEPGWDLILLVTQMSSLTRFTDTKQEPKPEVVSLCNQIVAGIRNLNDGSELKGLVANLLSLVVSLEPEEDGESEVLSLLYQLMSDDKLEIDTLEIGTMGVAAIIQLVYLVKFLNLDSKPKQGLNVIPLISQLISVAKSISDSDSEWELVSMVTLMVSLISSLHPKQKQKQYLELQSLIIEIFIHVDRLDLDSKLRPYIRQIKAHVRYLESNSKPETYELISLSPQSELELESGKFRVIGQVHPWGKAQAVCRTQWWELFSLGTKQDKDTHFRCIACNGKKHQGHTQAPVAIQHPLHPKHSLQLVYCNGGRERKCYCCEEDLISVFYYCSACDYAMNIACAEKQSVTVVDHPKWHEHTLQLFPRRVFLTCNLCALADSSSPIYMCPPCDFVAHLRCINLPRVIKISRHPHRISFTSSFVQGDRSCGVCHKKIDSDYGGYSCLKEGCSYTAHSRCATQSNIWDGKELEGEPEEIEEEVLEPFVRISDGIIEHFLHQQHHLRLDEDMGRDYDDKKQCSACIMPIYVGNIYSCMQCEFIMHETCANLSRKVHHPIHAHPLTLEGADEKRTCAACPQSCTAGFMYKCCRSDCIFYLHVQCNKTSEPLLHESHRHPLFLTSKPGERRTCGGCKYSRSECTNETFNCIEECDFALCFKCATIPQKARYKHDKHMFTLSCGEKTSTLSYWCEICEGIINPERWFYKCGEYCCVTLHIACLIGKDLYMKPNSTFNDVQNYEGDDASTEAAVMVISSCLREPGSANSCVEIN